MWDKARSLAAKHLKPAFVNLKNVSSEDQETKTPEVSETSVETPAGELPQADPAEVLAGVTAERDQLQSEVADLQDRLLRRQAEFENFRRRSERDRSDFLQYAGMEIVRDILPILDDFERALKTESSDAGYRKGVELIYQRLLDTLKKIGLEPVEAAAGQAFDPNAHQAVVRSETGEAEDNTILEEFQRGYNFKGKLLRPAMVKVAVRPAQ
jgi:molecular chaperone GrpE